MCFARLRSLVATCVLLGLVSVFAAAQTRDVSAPAHTGDVSAAALRQNTAAATPQQPAAVVRTAADDLTLEQRLDLLSNGRIVREKGTKKGVTAPRRLTLRYGDLEHDALFQAIDESKWEATFRDGRREMQFRDYWGFNVAAFEIARLLGFPDLIPPTVQRYHRGREGALCWWVTVMADEQERRSKGLSAPDAPAWTRQVMVSRVFEALFGDTDRNLTNTLITPDWRLVMIDFTRAFRTRKELKTGTEKLLLQCDRRLLEALRKLTAADVERVAGRWLDRFQIEALLYRRDLIVAHFDALVAARGESIVLF